MTGITRQTRCHSTSGNQASRVKKRESAGNDGGGKSDLRSSRERNLAARVLNKLAESVETVGMKLAEDGIGSRSRQERPSVREVAGTTGKGECTMDSTDGGNLIPQRRIRGSSSRRRGGDGRSVILTAAVGRSGGGSGGSSNGGSGGGGRVLTRVLAV